MHVDDGFACADGDGGDHRAFGDEQQRALDERLRQRTVRIGVIRVHHDERLPSRCWDGRPDRGELLREGITRAAATTQTAPLDPGDELVGSDRPHVPALGGARREEARRGASGQRVARRRPPALDQPAYVGATT